MDEKIYVLLRKAIEDIIAGGTTGESSEDTLQQMSMLAHNIRVKAGRLVNIATQHKNLLGAKADEILKQMVDIVDDAQKVLNALTELRTAPSEGEQAEG